MDSIRIEYLKGEGSPQGIVKNKIGFHWEDTLTNDVYVGMGGTSWRLTKRGETELFERTVDTASEIEDIKDLGSDEGVFIQDRGVVFRRNGKSQESFVRLEQDNHVGFISTDFPSTTDYFQAGDTFEMDITIVDRGAENAVIMYLLTANNVNDFAIQLYYSGGLGLSMRNSTAEVFDRAGNVIPAGLPIGERVKIVATVTSDFALSSHGLFINNHLYGRTGCIVEFHGMKITTANGGTDKFVVKPSTTQIVNEDETKIFDLSTAGTPLIDETPLDLDEIIDANKNILVPEIFDGYITPQMLGYNEKLNQDFNFTNDVAEYLQFCLDSQYNVFMPGGNYYLGSMVRIKNGTELLMSGSSTDIKSDNTTTTMFYSDKNITFLSMEGTDVSIKNGTVVFNFITDIQNPVGLQIGGNQEIETTWRVYIDKFSVFNDYIKLRQGEDIGGIGIKLNTDFDDKEKETSYMINGVYITNLDVTGVAIGVHSPTFSPRYREHHGWSNSIQIHGRISSCKEGTHLAGGGANIFDIDIMGQDHAVLMESEREKYFHYFAAPFVNYDVFTYDMFRLEKDPENNYRHGNGKHIYSVHPTNNAVGKSFIHWGTGSVTKVYNSNRDTVVQDPSYLAISGVPENATQFTNQLSHAGMDADFSYKGYIEPDDIELTPQDNAATTDGDASIGTFSQELNSPEISVETTDTNETPNYVRITSTSVEETTASIEIPVEAGKLYKLSFDTRGSGSMYKMVTEGLEEDLYQTYTTDKWKTREYKVIPNGSTLKLNFSPIVGMTSEFEGISSISWKDSLLRGKDYTFILTDGIDTITIDYTSVNTGDSVRDAGEDAAFLNAFFVENGHDILVTRAGWRWLTFSLNNEFNGNNTTLTTILKGSIGEYLDIDRLSLIESWKDNNLMPADHPLNSIVLSEASSGDIAITNTDFMTRANQTDLNWHVINNEKAFAEIVVPIQGVGQKIRRILMATSNVIPKRAQVSIVNLSTLENHGVYEITDEIVANSLVEVLPTWWQGRNDISTHLIFRFFGTADLGKAVSIRDLIATTQQNVYNPFVSKRGGVIETQGNLVSKSPVADGAMYDQTDVQFQFTDDVPSFPIINYRSTILLINTSGSAKNFLFDTNGSNSNIGYGPKAGKEYMIFCGKRHEPFSYPAILPASADINITNVGNFGINTLDGQPLVLKAGEWIKVKLVKSGGNNTTHKLIEITRSNILSYSFFSSI